MSLHRRLRPGTGARALVLALASSVCTAQPAAPSAAPTHLRCTAALEALSEQQVLAWARQPSESSLAAYESTLRRGAAFIAQAYLAGNRDEEGAKKALAQERQAVEAMPAVQLAQVQANCAATADTLLTEASAVQRWLLERIVKRHSAKERRKLQPASAPTP